MNRDREVVERYAAWVIRWRWPIVLMTLVFLAAVASGGRFVEFTNDYRVFFSKDNPQLKQLEAVENIYVKNENILFVIAPKDKKVFSPEVLKVIHEMTTALWLSPDSGFAHRTF